MLASDAAVSSLNKEGKGPAIWSPSKRVASAGQVFRTVTGMLSLKIRIGLDTACFIFFTSNNFTFFSLNYRLDGKNHVVCLFLFYFSHNFVLILFNYRLDDKS